MAKRHAVRESSTDTQNLDRLGPAALPLLPMIYVAWADGVLTPTELRVISERCESNRCSTSRPGTHLKVLADTHRDPIQ